MAMLLVFYAVWNGGWRSPVQYSLTTREPYR
ncbi:hypothetical protein H4W34_001483 [Actinomadura algeriensis]|uniref:Uncharacterized protein n=1 Tax=Actinomadura algeriensis TaxID=1679523 RepID=A0ABR9JM77_9ACTN|nr:hypothetical protein [Actinomadura algeriensis]